MSPRGLASALVLAIAGLALAWLCLRTTIVGTLPATAPVVKSVAPDNADVVLTRATLRLAQRPNLIGGTPRGFDPATLAAVRRAAAIAPLDARYFLILGYQQLAEGQQAKGIKTLEAGQRLDPRNRIIHLVLLERYLLTNRFVEAGQQMSVLSRLVSAVQPMMASAMAQMMIQPDMRNAARQALRTDPILERSVLTTLARGDNAPADIFNLASPAGIADAGQPDSWGPVLVSRLVATDRFQTARAIWQRVYGLSTAAVAAPVFNPSFAASPASAPFNWTLAASGLGAADPRNGALEIDYYGRDSGDLASQMIVLSPKRYTISFAAEGGKPDSASHLFWTVACAGAQKIVLANIPVPVGPGLRRARGMFTVPADCSAQTLTLRAEAGEFPAPIALTIKDLVLRPSTEATP